MVVRRICGVSRLGFKWVFVWGIDDGVCYSIRVLIMLIPCPGKALVPGVLAKA